MECEGPTPEALQNHWANIFDEGIQDRKKDFLRRLQDLQKTVDDSIEPLPDWIDGNKHYLQNIDGLTFMMEQNEVIYNVIGIWNEDGESEPLFL